MIEGAILKLKEMIENSKLTVILTGAGMDTESNIPDFRSKDGWWRNIDPRTVASTDALYGNYELFHEFYSMRINNLTKCKPHRGHYILTELQEKGLIHSVATQNVSGLQNLSGTKNIYELHGNIQRIRCERCSEEATIEEFLNKHNCKECGSSMLRPGVTLFGESLPQEDWNNAIRDIEKADLLIVIGTSLQVSPVNQLPLMMKGNKVLINREDVDEDYDFHLKILGSAGDVLRKLEEAIE
ncbi:NAD-dependent deacylase [Anaeromicrobium sediminis]|uniref:protein acetyllysine N-acetyltransferase n=1 Tax=Anaeromicrobium sediminis TaxID=1478221 RepID=A0A267ML52_9FIRM|nr:NAD-dependent deacylase [Anaeromicrobium sediminis]PAB60266.1 NAD-dependent protein deacylase [Anaeromicrobium sediminis]